MKKSKSKRTPKVISDKNSDCSYIKYDTHSDPTNVIFSTNADLKSPNADSFELVTS